MSLSVKLLSCRSVFCKWIFAIWDNSLHFPLWILPLLAIRFRLLKHTRLNVVAFLNELPKTQHDIASFTVDVNTYTVSSCIFCQSARLNKLFLLLWIISLCSVLILQKYFLFTEYTTIIHSKRSLQRRWVILLLLHSNFILICCTNERIWFGCLNCVASVF